jgi:hypothetical protein
MRKLAVVMSVAALVGISLTAAPKQASARMEYLNAFVAKYDIAEAKEKKCLVCHGAKKTERSDYAQEIGKALGAKMVKDMDKINAALETVESKEYEDGKTYGQLLKDKKLPAPFKAAE